MQDGTSREEFEGEARGLQTALEWAQREGADTHRHELLALVVSAMAIENPGKLHAALGEIAEKVAGWRADLTARLGPSRLALAADEPLRLTFAETPGEPLRLTFGPATGSPCPVPCERECECTGPKVSA